VGEVAKKIGNNRAANDAAHKSSIHAFDELSSRRSAELVISLCGPVGSGVSFVKETLFTELEARSYKVLHIKVSDLIDKKALALNISCDTSDDEDSPEFNRIYRLQTLGNELRSALGDDVGAQLAMEEIAIHRTREHPGKSIEEIVPGRVAYVIDQLKNPKEVALLRAVYRDLFFMVGVLASYNARKSNLSSMTSELAERLIERDRKESNANGQQLEKTLHQSDFFISNTHGNSNRRSEALKRFVGLIHGDNGLTPTAKERGMFAAFTAGLRSACLSRQVGASIMSPEGNLISTGCNDVPRAGGGLYEGGDDDQRCFFQKGLCHNDRHKNSLKEDIARIIQANGISSEKSIALAEKIKQETRVGALIEFSRAVHAEMDAIVGVAREGGAKVAGAIMFTTTYPCHSCARHIVAAGIKAVYFIEPYEKSLASDLHDDSITHDPDVEPDWSAMADISKVAFLQFEGVSPRNYSEFFQSGVRKDASGNAKKSRINADKCSTEYLDDYKELESRVIQRLHNAAKDVIDDPFPPAA